MIRIPQLTGRKVRNLILVLGDQLNLDNPALVDYRKNEDLVCMIECIEEATHVWSHKARIALFLSAMRHFANELTAAGIEVCYIGLSEQPAKSLSDGLSQILQNVQVKKLVVCEPGDYRVENELLEFANEQNLALAIREDTHYMISRHAFKEWAGSKTSLRMETFYRKMRKENNVLMDPGVVGEPLGGLWNFDKENRGTFGKKGPTAIPGPVSFSPDKLTTDVFGIIEQYYSKHPGSLVNFRWPVTRTDALSALNDFIAKRLPSFGDYQDAMWSDQPFLYHALISTSLNLKLLNPREVIDAAEKAYAAGHISLASAEGFIRQVLGWREFIRGVYWRDMPKMAEDNFFKHKGALPKWYWTGKTDMRCMQQVIGQTLDHGYAHHIQRLMVTGNFALIAGLLPEAVCDWYLAVYVDAIDWVERPNTVGMSLYANGGRFTSKPYAASGAYINRMSNYCKGCRYNPAQKTGEGACPMTTFYWDFLNNNEAELAKNNRASMMLIPLKRMTQDERAAVKDYAQILRNNIDEL